MRCAELVLCGIYVLVVLCGRCTALPQIMRAGLRSWCVAYGVGFEGQTMACWSKLTMTVDAAVVALAIALLVDAVTLELVVSWTHVFMSRCGDVGRSLLSGGALERVVLGKRRTKRSWQGF